MDSARSPLGGAHSAPPRSPAAGHLRAHGHERSVPSTPNVTALRGSCQSGSAQSSPRTPVLRSATNAAAAFSSPVHTPCLASSRDALRSTGARTPVPPVSELSLESTDDATSTQPWDGAIDWRYEFDAPRFEDFSRSHYREAKAALDAIVYGGDVTAQAAWTDLTLVLAESDTHYAWFQRPHAEHEPSTPATPAGPLISPAGIASTPSTRSARSTPRSPQSPSVRRAKRDGSPALEIRSPPSKPAVSPRTPLCARATPPAYSRQSSMQHLRPAVIPQLGRVLEAHVRPVESPARSSSSIERAMDMAAMGLSSVSSAGPVPPTAARRIPAESDAEVRTGALRVCGLGDDSGIEDSQNTIVSPAPPDEQKKQFAVSLAPYTPQRSRGPNDVSSLASSPCMPVLESVALGMIATPSLRLPLPQVHCPIENSPSIRSRELAQSPFEGHQTAAMTPNQSETPTAPRLKKPRAAKEPSANEPNENTQRPLARVNPPRGVRVNAARIDDLKRMLAEHNERLRSHPRSHRR